MILWALSSVHTVETCCTFKIFEIQNSNRTNFAFLNMLRMEILESHKVLTLTRSFYAMFCVRSFCTTKLRVSLFSLKASHSFVCSPYVLSICDLRNYSAEYETEEYHFHCNGAHYFFRFRYLYPIPNDVHKGVPKPEPKNEKNLIFWRISTYNLNPKAPNVEKLNGGKPWSWKDRAITSDLIYATETFPSV